jgi:putative phage-type endonuclease
VTQHSADWYSQRRNRLTASEFAQILDGRRGALLRQKLRHDEITFMAASPVGIAQPDGEMNATTWGHRFEPITRRIYELEIAGVGTVCDTLGRFTHSTIPWLSASPDGVVMSGSLQGRLVEIKSPKTRKPGKYVPFEYYVQMQVQMEVCDVDSVEFVEAQFAQKPMDAMTIGYLSALAKARWKGEIEVRGNLEDSSTWRYRYTEPVEDSYEATFPDSKDSTESQDSPNNSVLEHSAWWLTGWYPRTVLRNREWWRTVGQPAAEKFWAEVSALREEAPAPCEGWIGSNS